jgi:hypothetical protein
MLQGRMIVSARQRSGYAKAKRGVAAQKQVLRDITADAAIDKPVRPQGSLA